MFNRSKNVLYKRNIIFVLGSILMGLGVSIATLGEKGTDSFSTLAIGISNHTPFIIGQANFVLKQFLVFVTIFIGMSKIIFDTIFNHNVHAYYIVLFYYL